MAWHSRVLLPRQGASLGLASRLERRALGTNAATGQYIETLRVVLTDISGSALLFHSIIRSRKPAALSCFQPYEFMQPGLTALHFTHVSPDSGFLRQGAVDANFGVGINLVKL